MFIEATGRKPGDTARLESHLVLGKRCSGENKNITFWYHMYGSDIGFLRVYFRQGGVLGAPVWTKEGKPN